MTKFFTKLLLFTSFSFVISNIIIYILIANLILPSTLPGGLIFGVLEKSKQKTTADKVILGDSVGYEFLYGANEKELKIHNLTSNQAVAMAGQYLFLKNALEANPKQFKEVYLLCRHTTLSNNLEQPFTWNYFVRPLVTLENMKIFTEDTKAKIKKSPFWWMVFIPMIRINPVFPPVDYLSLNNTTPETPLFSFTTIEYARKIRELCEKNNLKFYPIAMPVPEIFKPLKSFYEKEARAQMKKEGLEDMFDNFFKTITFLPDKLYRDGSHFNINFTIEERWDVINTILRDKKLPFK